MIRRIVTTAVLSCLIGFSASHLAIAQEALDGASREQVKSAILEQLDRYALPINNLFYTSFEISSGTAPPPQQSGGFAEPLMPQGAPTVRKGLMEITPYNDWSFAVLPDGRGGWSGVVSLRLFKYRVLADRGWSHDSLLMLHFWEWNVKLDASGLHVTVKMDQSNFPTDNGPQELVASIYNVPPTRVSVSRPDPNFVNQVLIPAGAGSPQTPARSGCRPCETQQADGSCKQWRACM
jgi:hypothetical protein